MKHYFTRTLQANSADFEIEEIVIYLPLANKIWVAVIPVTGTGTGRKRLSLLQRK